MTNNCNLTEGDLVSGRGRTVGKYLGHQIMKIDGKELTFCAVYDPQEESKFLIPIGRKKELNLLPTPNELKDCLKEFPTKEEKISLSKGQNRFSLYSDLLMEGKFKNVYSVTNDLFRLKINKKITQPERILFEKCKKIFLKQLSLVLNKNERVLNFEIFDEV